MTNSDMGITPDLQLAEPTNAVPRVLVVTKRLDIGGTEQHLLRVLPQLAAHGVAASLYVLERGGVLEAALAKSKVAIAGIPRCGGRFWHLAKSAAHLHRHLRRTRPDIVHFFLTEPYLIGSLAALPVPGLQLMMSRRSLNHYQARHGLLAALERWLHRRTVALVGNSRAVVEDLRRECNAGSKIGLIHNGLAPSESITAVNRVERRRELGIADDHFVISVHANLFPYKGHADLIEALGLITPLFGRRWRLLLVGKDEGDEVWLRRLAAQLDIAENILWLGQRTDALRLLDAVDVSVLPSHEEGFSNSLIEAMGRGLPVIATAVGGNIDAVEDKVSGLLVPPRQPEILSVAITDLMKNENLRAVLGYNARKRVMHLFSLDQCVRRYSALYHGILHDKQQNIQTIIDGAK